MKKSPIINKAADIDDEYLDTDLSGELENYVDQSFGDSDQHHLLTELEADVEESRIEVEEAFEEEYGVAYSPPSMSLTNKLIATGGDFPVSPNSKYIHNIWYLPTRESGIPINIHFNSPLSGFNELKKALVYHTIKDFNPFGTIRSYSTARHYGHSFNHIEKYVFSDNHLTANPHDIKLISLTLLRKTLERAKQSLIKTHYLQVYTCVRLWINLSEHNLIPKDLQLEIKLSSFDTPELRDAVFKIYFNRSISTWVAFTEEDLEALMEYALYWLEAAAPEMMKLRDYLSPIINTNTKCKLLIARERIPELEKLLDVTVEGKVLMQVKLRLCKYQNGGAYVSYAWHRQYGKILDNIRNAVFILLALITGARKSELAPLKFSDVYTDGKGLYWLNIKRFKTANDPTVGEADTLPLPKFIGDAVKSLERLKEIGGYMKQGWIFQSNKNKSLKKATPKIVSAIIEILRVELPIERLHCHRFRKTIAEILINRDERNVELIRALFGHRSYSMTMQYIARNPLMVRTVAIAIEQNYTKEFHDIVAGITYGGFSGVAADRIHAQMQKRPDEFTGKQLKVSLLSYIVHILSAGEPIFIRRTAVGTYCLSGEHYSVQNMPPCLANKSVRPDVLTPDPSNCQPDCKKLIVLASAKKALTDNIIFYAALLEKARGKLAPEAERELIRRISATEAHLKSIQSTSNPENTLIGAIHV